MIDLLSLTWSHLQEARAAPNGRSAGRVVHDGDLRQTVVALAAGTELGEHNSPHAATLQVLHGRVRVSSPSGDDDLGTGALHLLTHERHAVRALEDAVFLLTTVTGASTSDSMDPADRDERMRQRVRESRVPVAPIGQDG